MSIRIVLILALSTLLGACASTTASSANADAAPVAQPWADAAARFDAMEARLVAAEALELQFAITSSGALASSLTGNLLIDGAQVALQAEGTFGGQPMSMSLAADALNLTLIGADGLRRQLNRPPKLQEALVLGLTRMGLLHNLAVLSSGRAPDGAAGGFRKFATCFCFAAEPPAGADDRMSFLLFIRGAKTAAVELSLSAEELPLRRVQDVEFPSGSMHVEENYSAVQIGPALSAQ